MVNSTLVVVPTYDEAQTLPETIARLRAAVPEADVLVVDDASPDGTGEIAESLAAADDAIHVLHRAGKQGLGAAYVAAFGWALARDYELVVEMDADGSHRPEDLPALLAAARSTGADLVIGSRWVPGGRVENWPAHRKVLSRGGNTYSRIMLGMPVRDATAGFRVYRAPALAGMDLGNVASQGYCFQVDLTWRVHRVGGRIVEVPICFVEREIGTSKMSRRIVAEALGRVTAWGVSHRTRQVVQVFDRSGRT